MEENDQIKKLNEKLDQLLEKQYSLSREIGELKGQIDQVSQGKDQMVEKKAPPISTFKPKPDKPKPKKRRQSDLERFIGQNLISTIGIIILILGVGIGAKYAIDHQMVSPVFRIVSGYVFAAALLVVAFRLKSRYEAYSAVLVSGSLAIMYVITFFAFSFYGLIPKLAAFGLMILITVFAVFSAIKYSREIIAHIGLVGAYAIPFLLSDGSGDVAALFTYMVLINSGILIISLKRYWKRLYYSAFAFTWLIFMGWYFFSYGNEPFIIPILFCSIFFLIFYATFVLYKLLRNEEYQRADIFLLLSNSFLFYAVGFAIFQDHYHNNSALALFTLINGAIHFLVGVVIFRKRKADKNLFFLTVGLAVLFLTISIPVKLNGNWVTLLWTGEAGILFWIGRTRNKSAYERLSYPLIFLAFFSLLQDWEEYYLANLTQLVFNVQFFSSLLVSGAFAAISYLHFSPKYSIHDSKGRTKKLLDYGLPVILLLSLYGSIYQEIDAYWYRSPDFTGIWHFRYLWLLNYTILFLAGLGAFNLFKIRNDQLAYVNVALSFLVFILFFTEGQLRLTELRETYLYGDGGFANLVIRYACIGFCALLLLANYLYKKVDFVKGLTIPFDVLLYLSTLILASSELVHWLDLYDFKGTYKLGLSILWGVIALLWILLGLLNRKKYLRMGAIVLFGITLIKLFFYDISHLSTISKTIVFVSLGVLLLAISFFYNRFAELIGDDKDKIE